MRNNDKEVDAHNEYERLLKVAEEKNYKCGWVYYQLKEKFGTEIAQEIMPPKYSYSDGDDLSDLFTDIPF